MNIYQKLVNIQNELRVNKTRENKFGGYNYRSAEDIHEAVKPLLLKYELALYITDDIKPIGERYYVTSTVSLTDGENTIQVNGYAREPESVKGQSEAQITGASSSYARKYALNGLFQLDDNKDPDATNTHGKEAPAAAKAKPETPSLKSKVIDLFDQMTPDYQTKLLTFEKIDSIDNLPAQRYAAVIKSMEKNLG